MNKLEKIVKLLGKDIVSEMDGADIETLNKIIVEAETSMKTAQDELDKNEQYQELKEKVKAMGAGKREVFARQKAKIAYALEMISSKGY
jgi:hypothetical protein